MFEITIKEITSETKTVGSIWEVVGQEDSGIRDSKGEAVLQNKYGYTPAIEKSVPISRDLYQQTIKDLDLPAVIKAINGI